MQSFMPIYFFVFNIQTIKNSFPGARFSKDPITYRAHKAIFNDLYLQKKALYRH